MHARLTGHTDIRRLIQTFDDTVQEICRATCKPLKTPTKKLRGKTVPWWSDALTTMRKRTNALRSLYQRTKINNGLMESRSPIRHSEDSISSCHKKGKNTILKETLHCNITDESMEWDIQNRLAKHDRRQIRQLYKNRMEQ